MPDVTGHLSATLHTKIRIVETTRRYVVIEFAGQRHRIAKGGDFHLTLSLEASDA